MLSCRRDHFSLPADLHYLNCAYMSPLSKRVEEVGIAALRRKRVPSTIGPPDFFSDCDAVRSKFARLIGCPDPARIAIVPSVSYGLSAAARNTPLEKGQNVVMAADQFPSNVYVWRRISRDAGAEIRVVGAPDARRRGRAWNEALLGAIDEATAVVALGQVHWTDGTRFDLGALGDRAREVGAALVIDGTQSIGATPFEVTHVRPDALVCAGYKWLMGPYSVGVAYYGERYDGGVPLEETWIGRVGSEDFRRLVDYQDEYRPGALRYDMGESSNFVLVPMLSAALDQILEWGVEAIEDYCRSLLAPLEKAALDRGWYVEREQSRAAHILGVGLPPGIDLDALRGALAEEHVAASLRGDALRISPHVYNEPEDIDAVLRAVEHVL